MADDTWMRVVTAAKQGFLPADRQADAAIAEQAAERAAAYKAQQAVDAAGLRAAPNVGSQLTPEQAEARFRAYVREQELLQQQEAARPAPPPTDGYRLMTKK